MGRVLDWQTGLSRVTWRGGISARHARNIMSDAGLAGPLPEFLFLSVLLATAFVLFV